MAGGLLGRLADGNNIQHWLNRENVDEVEIFYGVLGEVQLLFCRFCVE